MAEFEVKVERITVAPHENADRLEIATIAGYQSIVLKGQFASGDLVAYIPEGAIVPAWLLEELGLAGRLAGPNKDRVKAIRLRGVLSQGICYPAHADWSEGQDVTELLGVTKYVPPVPTCMAGVVYGAGGKRCIRYDIENWKRYPDVIADEEPVTYTEKIHGTWTQIGLMPRELAHPEHGRLVTASKGLADKGLAFIPDAQENQRNLYLRVVRRYAQLPRQLDPDTQGQVPRWIASGLPVFILGETFGAKVQDLGYGASAAEDHSIGFRVFDVYLGTPGSGRYLDDPELSAVCKELSLQRVPVLYRGPFSRETMEQYTNGRETISGRELHVREGIVITPLKERRDETLGRVKLKSVSSDYLLRRNATEFV